jgi:hypothetical protein
MMKKTAWIAGIAVAGLMALPGVGCKKETPAQQAPTFNRVQVDIPKLLQATAAAGQPAHTAVNKLRQDLRYHKYDEALARLDSLKEMPELNDEQKKVIDQITEQVKQAAKAHAASAATPVP